MTTARPPKYAIFLSGYTYDIKYRKTTKHDNVDALSLLPLSIDTKSEKDYDAVFYSSQMEK